MSTQTGQQMNISNSFLERHSWIIPLSIFLIFVGIILAIVLSMTLPSHLKPKKSCIKANGTFVKGSYDKKTNTVICPPGSCRYRDAKYLTCNTLLNEDGSVYLKDQCKCNETTSEWECTLAECPGFPGKKCTPIDFMTNENDVEMNALRFPATKCKNTTGIQYYSPNKYCGSKSCTATQADLQRCYDRKGIPKWHSKGNHKLICVMEDGSTYTINANNEQIINPVTEKTNDTDDTDDTDNTDDTDDVNNTDNTDNTDTDDTNTEKTRKRRSND